jgi:Domain of unknown function (DUF4129)
LHRGAGSQALWLTIIGAHVESFLIFGAIGLLFLLVPNDLDLDWLALLGTIESAQFDWISNLLYLAAIALVGPFYAAAGFTLYLNRRIVLEGWDIELGFRRLTARLGRGALAAWLVVLPVCLCGLPHSADAAVDTTATDESKALIDAVLAEPEFNEEQVISVPQFLVDLFEPSEPSRPVEIGWLVELASHAATVVEMLLWVVAAGVTGALLVTLWRARVAHDVPPRPGEAVPIARGAADDVVAAARQAWVAGQQRAALAQLYRAALALLSTRYDCRVAESDTEADCLRRAGEVCPAPVMTAFAQLTRFWQRLAYAHRVPDDIEFAQLCEWFAVLERERRS